MGKGTEYDSATADDDVDAVEAVTGERLLASLSLLVLVVSYFLFASATKVAKVAAMSSSSFGKTSDVAISSRTWSFPFFHQLLAEKGTLFLA